MTASNVEKSAFGAVFLYTRKLQQFIAFIKKRNLDSLRSPDINDCYGNIIYLVLSRCTLVTF